MWLVLAAAGVLQGHMAVPLWTHDASRRPVARARLLV